MRSAITISLVPEARGGPFVFWDDLVAGCAQAAKLGFDAVEIFPPSADDLNAKELRRLLRDHKLQLAALGTGAGWVKHKLRLTDPDPVIRRRAHDFIAAIVDFAGAFDAPAIIGSMQGRWDTVSRDHALAWLAEALEQLGPRAAALGVPLLYEPLNRYETNLFTRVADAVEFLKPLRTQNVKLLCDLFHMNIEEADIAAALRVAGDKLGHVHFADSNRQAIGFGHTPMKPIIQALRDIRYDGYLSAEILPLPDSNTAAHQTINSFHTYARTRIH
ncbi:MAG: sugar phosphate isomerase/epimerase family protein [Verrucomicrobiota bacterium]